MKTYGLALLEGGFVLGMLKEQWRLMLKEEWLLDAICSTARQQNR